MSTPSGSSSARVRGKANTRLAQFRQIWGLASAGEPRLGLYVGAILLGALVLGGLIGAAIGHPIYLAILFLLLGLLVCVWLVARKAEAGAYGQIAGQPGEVGAVLGSIRRGWSYKQEPVAVEAGNTRDPHQAALVYRAVGQPGVVLIAEGPTGRAIKLLTSERKRVARLVPNVPVHTFRVGTGEGADVVASRDLVKRMNKLDKVLTKTEVPAIDQRLRSLTTMRPQVPQGIDPNRMKGKRAPR